MKVMTLEQIKAKLGEAKPGDDILLGLPAGYLERQSKYHQIAGAAHTLYGRGCYTLTKSADNKQVMVVRLKAPRAPHGRGRRPAQQAAQVAA